MCQVSIMTRDLFIDKSNDTGLCFYLLIKAKFQLTMDIITIIFDKEV